MSTKRRLMTVDDVQGAWAILPTPATPKASDWREQDTVDLDETARAVEGLVEAGVDAILTLGTLGECATLTWEEKRKFIAAAVDAARGRVPVFSGATSLSTRETIRQTREMFDLGASGTMLGLPMWCSVDLPTAVQFYEDVAEACPASAICVYANNEAFRFAFPPPFWGQVSRIPQVIAAKYMGVGQLVADLRVSERKIRLLPIDFDYYAAARIDPDFCTAFWTSGAVCGPALATRLRDEIARAKATGSWNAAKALTDDITQSVMPLIPRGSIVEFGKYNIGLEKARMNAAGWMNAGPTRPPYHIVPEEYLEGARRSGRMWAELVSKYGAKSSPSAKSETAV